MHNWKRALLALAAPLLLAGCLWGPGKFSSTLDLRKDGSFTLDYRGELTIDMPDESKAAVWSDSMARCFTDGRTEIDQSGSAASDGNAADQTRACAPAENAKLKAQFVREAGERLAAKRKENEEMAKVFGLPGLDDTSARAFAVKLMKYAGWRSVVYRGDGMFDVDYHLAGRATQDFLFPVLPDNALILPFIALRRRADGTILVTAPALAGPSGLGAPPGMNGGGPFNGPTSRAEGRLTITTDGEVLTNNSEDGPARTTSGHALHWDVTPALAKIPETLIRL